MSAYKHILVALDTNTEADQILAKALEQAHCFASKLSLIHVVEPLVLENSYDMLNSLPIELEDELVKRAELFLASISDSIEYEVDRIVGRGAIKNVIFETVKSKKVDLIIVGSHGRHGVVLLLGSTANAILHGAESDLHVVRIKAKS